jgi:hypothetical protein
VLNFCKNNGIILLSFPTHTTHHLQPLDISVFGPFKKYYFATVDNWMISNPGKILSIYDIPKMVNAALPKALSQQNIVSSFAATGIMPFNPDIFTDADYYLSSDFTDRPLHEHTASQEAVPGCSTSLADDIEHFDSGPSTNSGSQGIVVSPEQLRPYPKAGERK